LEFAAQVGRRVEEGRPLIRETLERLRTTGATRPSPESQGPASAPAGYHMGKRSAGRELMGADMAIQFMLMMLFQVVSEMADR
jgi:hypothetical protein